MTDKKLKKAQETDPEQSERFRKAVRDLEATGELSPTEGDKAFERVLKPLVPHNPLGGR